MHISIHVDGYIIWQENTSLKIFQTNFWIVLCFTTFRHYVNKDMFCSVQLYIYMYLLEGLVED